MKLIVGLGNPGTMYEKTRHNAGWIAIDILIEKYGFNQIKKEHQALVFFATINSEKVLFVKPQTYMNNSGEAVKQILAYYKINILDMIIIHDEKDFEVGKNQFKKGGSAGGHNGVKSVIAALGTQDFFRYRIGIGQPQENWKIIDWVLSKLNQDEIKLMTSSLLGTSDFVKEWVEESSWPKIMNKYN